MKRDFTEATKTEFINLVQEANESEWLKKKNPLDNVDDLLTFDVQFPWNTLEAYYRKMIDKNDMTVGKINKIWENVQILDSTYQARFLALNELAVAYKEKLRLLSNKIKPENIVNTLKSPSRQLEAELVTVNEKLNMSRKRYIYTLLIECKDDKVVGYNWKLLEQYLEKDTEKILDEEYQALLMVIGEMDLNDLEKFANNSYIYSDTFWNGSHPKLSPVFIRLAEKYESIMTKIVESGILTSGQLKDEWEKNLMHHLETAAILNCICKMKEPGWMQRGKYVTISNKDGHYTVYLDYTDFINHDSPLGVADEIDKAKKKDYNFEVFPFGDYNTMDYLLDIKTISNIKNEKKTDTEVIVEDISSLLFSKGIDKVMFPEYSTILQMIANVQSNRENNAKIDRNITGIQLGNYLESLYMSGNIAYEDKGEIFLKNNTIDDVKLNVSIHLYNKSHSDITIEQLVAGLDEKNSNEVKVLDEYTKWFKSPDDVGMAGKSKVEEYLGDLRSIMQNYANEHPEIKLTNLESLSEEQLRELIKKKENSWYVIKDSIMED